MSEPVGPAGPTTVGGGAGDALRALDLLPDLVLVMDQDWRVSYANRAARAQFAARGEPLGRALWDLWPGLHHGGQADELRRTAQRGTGIALRVFDVDADRWWHLRAVPTRPGAVTLVAADVTAAAPWEAHESTHRAGSDLSRPEQAQRVLAYTAALAEAESLQEVTEVVATMVLPSFGAAGMLVSLLESGRLRMAGHAGYSGEAVRRLDVIEPEDNLPIALTLRSREALFLHSRAAYLGHFPGNEVLVAATGKQAWAFLPLLVSGRALGVLTVSFAQPHDFPSQERALLRSVSTLVAQTIARARLRDLERSLAAELQSHLLPRVLPRLTGITAYAAYLPATDGMGVGGDWYDLLELPGGQVGLVIGDVQGHNMRAAAVMGQLRNALRAYAAEGHQPSAVLSRTNRLMSDLDPTLFATCAYLALDPLTGRGQLAVAGHPPPVLRDPRGSVRTLSAPVGPPLGVLPDEEYSVEPVRLDPGDTLVFFTDGLVEDSHRPMDEGLARLASLLSDVPSSAGLDEAVELLVAGARVSAARSDDIAVLMVRNDGVPAHLRPRHARSVVDRSDPRAARAARDLIAGFIDGTALAELRDTCVLLVSEVVTNALRHTDGEVALELWHYPDRLRVEVADETSRAVHSNGAGPLDESGRGVPLMDALSSRWGSAPHGAGKVVWFELDLLTG